MKIIISAVKELILKILIPSRGLKKINLSLEEIQEEKILFEKKMTEDAKLKVRWVYERICKENCEKRLKGKNHYINDAVISHMVGWDNHTVTGCTVFFNCAFCGRVREVNFNGDHQSWVKELVQSLLP